MGHSEVEFHCWWPDDEVASRQSVWALRWSGAAEEFVARHRSRSPAPVVEDAYDVVVEYDGSMRLYTVDVEVEEHLDACVVAPLHGPLPAPSEADGEAGR